MPTFHVRPSAALTLLVFVVLGGGVSFYVILAAVLHELGHIAAMYITSRPPISITIYPFGAEILRKSGICTYFGDFFVYVAGAAVNIICAGAFYVVSPIFAHISLAVGAFNLLPLESFDGERALYSLLAYANGDYTALKICRMVSAASLFLLWMAAIWAVLFAQMSIEPLLLCIYMFIANINKARLPHRGACRSRQS